MTKYSLGAILLKHGLLTRNQLDEALRKQRQQAETQGWQLLGEILVELRFITKQDLEEALERQARLIEIEFFGIRVHSSTKSLFKRGLDIVGASVGLTATIAALPVIAAAIYMDSPGPILVSQPRVGLRGRQFKLWKFRTTTPDAERHRLKLSVDRGCKFFNQKDDPHITRVGKLLRQLYLDEMPQFFNVLKGEMSLVGTRPPTLDEAKCYTSSDWKRLAVKPGMTGLWQINQHKYGMDFDKIVELDTAYINRWKFYDDLGILLGTVLHILRGSSGEWAQTLKLVSNQSKVSILNVSIDNLSMTELLQQLKSGVVLTPNVDHLMKVQADSEFYRTYTQADYRVCDSQILMYASRFLGTPLREKISGSDFFPAFCQFHQENLATSIFLLGGAEGVAEKAKERINRKTGRDIIVQAHSPSFGFERNEQECQEIVELINQSKATVLAVGVGAPKQEKWIYKYKDQLTHIKIFLAIGATIDFEAGVVKRAPKWMSQIGMEWLFRIASDPQRLWKRYLMDDLPFFWLVLQQKLGLYTPPFIEPVRRGILIGQRAARVKV